MELHPTPGTTLAKKNILKMAMDSKDGNFVLNGVLVMIEALMGVQFYNLRESGKQVANFSIVNIYNPVLPIPLISFGEEEPDNGICTVCQEYELDGDEAKVGQKRRQRAEVPLRMPGCQHYFHRGCILQHAFTKRFGYHEEGGAREPDCPLCRQPLG